jgi:hypothetical protein
VHYVSYGTPESEYTQECRAAIVAEVDSHEGRCGLAVLNPTGIFLNRGVWQAGRGREAWRNVALA